MATPRTIIQQAFEDLAVVQPGELIVPGGSIELSAFQMLLQLYGSWLAEDLANFNAVELAYNLVDNIDSYTLGIGGSFNTVVYPFTRVTSWGARFGNFTSGGDIITIDEFHARRNSRAEVALMPDMVASDNGYPLMQIRVYPFPTHVYGGSTMAQLYLKGWYAAPAFANVTDTIVMPSEYFLALHANLAISLAPQYARVGGVTPELAALASNSKGVIVARNAAILGFTKAQQPAA